MKNLILIVAISLLSACFPTEQGYIQVLETWKGQPEARLVSSWGAPDSSYASGSRKFLTYNDQISGYVPGTSPNYYTSYYGNTAYTTSYGGTSGYSYTENCKTTFTIFRGLIEEITYQGSACVAMEE